MAERHRRGCYREPARHQVLLVDERRVRCHEHVDAVDVRREQ